MDLDKIVLKIKNSELDNEDILKYGKILITEFAKEYHKKQLLIGDVGCQREQLKTTKEPLPYDEWKKHLKIQKPNNQIYKIGDEYITLNEVLEMYEEYYHSF